MGDIYRKKLDINVRVSRLVIQIIGDLRSLRL